MTKAPDQIRDARFASDVQDVLAAAAHEDDPRGQPGATKLSASAGVAGD